MGGGGDERIMGKCVKWQWQKKEHQNIQISFRQECHKLIAGKGEA